ncbi:serine/threonine-protein phosphatase 7 long form-like protein [Gossypium australe]|uniref:Serine/threonine-protein phosphatase 7 long form-like protein n=1 Tax=Gossypium australe TaxID=47621 RepID=A0A5B6VFD1_9ROSI|nr:serine/threonine-protein phosphatase 7 long form-like protein [Gossypium australe]
MLIPRVLLSDKAVYEINGQLLSLLQSWALYRMPFLASVSHQPYVRPLVNRRATVPETGDHSPY